MWMWMFIFLTYQYVSSLCYRKMPRLSKNDGKFKTRKNTVGLIVQEPRILMKCVMWVKLCWISALWYRFCKQNFIGLSVLELPHVLKLLGFFFGTPRLDLHKNTMYRFCWFFPFVSEFLLSFYLSIYNKIVLSPWIYHIYISINNKNQEYDTIQYDQGCWVVFSRKSICILPD